MKPRLNFFNSPDLQPMIKISQSIESAGLEKSLLELVKMRASQINSCSFCLDMHSKDARKHGETEQRLYLLSGWRELPLYSERERAALGWTEALTLVSQTHAPDSDYEALKPHFTEDEIVKLTMMIVTINGWNRIAIGFRAIHPVEKASVAA